MKMKILVLLFVCFVPIHLSKLNLCDSITKQWKSNDGYPKVVMIREQNSNDSRMISAIDDAACFVNKSFEVIKTEFINTINDTGIICYRLSTIPLQYGQLMVVITEGDSIDECPLSIYGPIPNILNIKLYVDVMQESRPEAYTKRLELRFENTGGHLSVQYALVRKQIIQKIETTIDFMFQLNTKTKQYGKLTPWWSPDVSIPPYEYTARLSDEEKEKTASTFSPFLLFASIPMILFGTIVSCYIVIQPRGGLTYTDEEVDFTLQEVESDVRVNTARDKSHHSLITKSMEGNDDKLNKTAGDFPVVHPLHNDSYFDKSLPLDVTPVSSKTKIDENEVPNHITSHENTHVS